MLGANMVRTALEIIGIAAVWYFFGINWALALLAFTVFGWIVGSWMSDTNDAVARLQAQLNEERNRRL